MKEGNCGDEVSLDAHRLRAEAVGLQSFERWCGDTIRRRVIFLYGRQGFAELFADFSGGVPKGLKHLLLTVSGDLLFGEQIAIAAVHGF